MTSSGPAFDMLAAVLHGPRDLRIERVPHPGPPGPGELLVEVAAVGLCGTDLGEWARPHRVPLTATHPRTGHGGPTVLGHEFAGTVVSSGAGVGAEWAGQVVASSGGVPCGQCPACAAGRASQCPHYWVVGLHRPGALARFVRVPARSCCVVDTDRLTPEEAALTQPMAVAVHAARRGRPVPGEPAVVVGVGGIGAALVHVLTQWGVPVTAIDTAPDRLAVAAELGAAVVLRAEDVARPGALSAGHGEPPALCYEATGVGAVLRTVLAEGAVGARIVLVGLQHQPLAVDFERVTLAEQELIGTNFMVPQTDLAEAQRLLVTRAGRWDVLAPRVIPLADVVPFAFAGDRESAAAPVKVLVDPSAGSSRGLYEPRPTYPEEPNR